MLFGIPTDIDCRGLQLRRCTLAGRVCEIPQKSIDPSSAGALGGRCSKLFRVISPCSGRIIEGESFHHRIVVSPQWEFLWILLKQGGIVLESITFNYSYWVGSFFPFWTVFELSFLNFMKF